VKTPPERAQVNSEYSSASFNLKGALYFSSEFHQQAARLQNLSIFWLLFTADLQSKTGVCVNFDSEKLKNLGPFYGNLV
jgi:hypothetical protein